VAGAACQACPRYHRGERERGHRREAAASRGSRQLWRPPVIIHGVYSIDQVGEAFEAFRQGTRGKLVLTIDWAQAEG
jgi:hypothetical protein